MSEDVVHVGFGYLDLLGEQMSSIGRQGDAITDYIGSQVCNPAGFGEAPCVLAPLAVSMARLRGVFDDANAVFAGRWAELQRVLVDSAGAFADRDIRSSHDHRALAARLDVRRDAAA